MSSRSNKGFVRNQKRYVPKSDHQSTSKPTVSALPLSSSLRQSTASRRPTPNSTSESSRLRLNHDGNVVAARHGGNFVKYLPQDEAVAAGLPAVDGALDPIESQHVVDLLNRELSRLLKSNPRDFWRDVASDESLHEFLDSYLKFRSRWYDFPHHGVKGMVAGVIVGDVELSRRVLMLLYRMSSNKDPGACANASLSAKDFGALLQEKKLLDLPKLLDICAIYGHDNKQLIELLVTNAMKSQPSLLDSLTAVVSHFLSIVSMMHQRCSSSLEALFTSGGEAHSQNQLYVDFLEVMDFINDAVVSLDAFVDAYRPAAICLCLPIESGSGNEELLLTLARLHDSLLPALQEGFRRIFTAREVEIQKSFGGTVSDIAISFKMLSVRIVQFGWKLLEHCYLSHDLFEGSNTISLLTAAKMFPAKVEDPVIRGDILVQTLREINGGISSDHLKGTSETFLQSIEKSHNILNQVDILRSSGWILMDSDQFQYLTSITKSHSSIIRGKKSDKPMDEDAAVIESRINQIKDLFPEYGKGFLSACLEVYDQNPEEVIQRILEGTLHKDLLALDTSLENVPPSRLSPLSKNDKGKGALITIEPAGPTPISSSNSVSSSSMAMVGPKTMDGPSSSSSTSLPCGRYTRKSKTDSPESVVLDSRLSEDFAKSLALASQYEYEDEYDDSFDELGVNLYGAASEETETFGDRIGSSPGISSRPEVEGSMRNSNSKWQSQKKPQFYVKDGKNYSYKVSGSVAASNLQEATLVNQSQKELIHGLGRGGNLPLGAVKALMESNEPHGDGESDTVEDTGGSQGTNTRGRGRGRGQGRGWGRGGGGNHYRKDRAMKKHFAGIGGY